MIKKPDSLLKSCWFALKYLYVNQLSSKATALAFTTLLTIVPLIAVVLYFFTYYLSYFHFELIAREYMANNFLPHLNTAIIDYLNTFSERAFKLSVFNILFF